MYIVILTIGKMRVHALAFTCGEPIDYWHVGGFL